MFALNLLVFIIILQGHLEISLGSRSTFVENMGKRSISVRNAQRFMLFNLIGRLTLKLVELESIDVTAAHFSPGKIASSLIEHFVMH